MDVPLRQQNALLLAVGYAPVWGERDLSAPDLAIINTALEYMLRQHRGLQPLLSSRTRLISLASPQNPSGVAVSPGALRETLGLMAEICPDAYLLVDETYREAAYADDPAAATAQPRWHCRSSHRRGRSGRRLEHWHSLACQYRPGRARARRLP